MATTKRLTVSDRLNFMRLRVKQLKRINTAGTRERARGLEEAIRIMDGYNDDEVRYEKKRGFKTEGVA